VQQRGSRLQRDHPRGLAAQDLGSLPVKACYVAPGGSPSMRTRGEVDVAKWMRPSPVARLLWERPKRGRRVEPRLGALAQEADEAPRGLVSWGPAEPSPRPTRSDKMLDPSLWPAYRTTQPIPYLLLNRLPPEPARTAK